jgi:excisionase family DNA binding protein
LNRLSKSSSKHIYLGRNSFGVSNICSHKSYEYETTFSPRAMLDTRKIRLNLQKMREQKYEYMYNKKEVANQLTVSMATVDRLIKTKKLTVVKIGSCIRVTDDALQQFIADCEVR